MFFAEKGADRTAIDYAEAVHGGLQLVPISAAAVAVAEDYVRMVDDGLLLEETEPFDALTGRCADLAARGNAEA